MPATVLVDGYEVTIGENGKVTVADGEALTPEPEIPKTVKEAKKAQTILSSTENTQITDEYGNQLIVPAGFKIAEDSATDVTGGVVIEDVSHEATAGSEFVWIPLETVYTNAAQTTSETINLNRYTFSEDGTPTPQGENKVTINVGKEMNYGVDVYFDYYELSTSDLGNAVTLKIEEFKIKATENHGYYIGRYEARTSVGTERKEENVDDGGQVTVRKDDYLYNYVTQPEAMRLSQEMYSDESNFISDLINSYAWDTAILFMQTFDNRTNKTKLYSRQNSINTGSIASQGTNHLEKASQDKICNIWDMASNSVEWATETSTNPGYPCTFRGGHCTETLYYTSFRYTSEPKFYHATYSFRPLLYVL